jgi:hypothetical protein
LEQGICIFKRCRFIKSQAKIRPIAKVYWIEKMGIGIFDFSRF